MEYQSNAAPDRARIARDYLVIQGSSIPSKEAFSSGRITGTARRSRLTTEIFDALQILKSAHHNGHLTAAHQAAQHLNALISEFDARNWAVEEESDS